MTGPRYKDQLGISLVELLVAMAIQFIIAGWHGLCLWQQQNHVYG